MAGLYKVISLGRTKSDNKEDLVPLIGLANAAAKEIFQRTSSHDDNLSFSGVAYGNAHPHETGLRNTVMSFVLCVGDDCNGANDAHVFDRTFKPFMDGVLNEIASNPTSSLAEFPLRMFYTGLGAPVTTPEA